MHFLCVCFDTCGHAVCHFRAHDIVLRGCACATSVCRPPLVSVVRTPICALIRVVLWWQTAYMVSVVRGHLPSGKERAGSAGKKAAARAQQGGIWSSVEASLAPKDSDDANRRLLR